MVGEQDDEHNILNIRGFFLWLRLEFSHMNSVHLAPLPHGTSC